MSQLLASSFATIKTVFNVSHLTKQLVIENQLFTLNDERIHFSSSEIYALIEFMLAMKRRQFLNLIHDLKYTSRTSFYGELKTCVFPKWMNRYDVVVNDALHDFQHALVFTRCCSFIHRIVRRINSRTTNQFRNRLPELKLLLAFH